MCYPHCFERYPVIWGLRYKMCQISSPWNSANPTFQKLIFLFLVLMLIFNLFAKLWFLSY